MNIETESLHKTYNFKHELNALIVRRTLKQNFSFDYHDQYIFCFIHDNRCSQCRLLTWRSFVLLFKQLEKVYIDPGPEPRGASGASNTPILLWRENFVFNIQ